jgi:hypothetical protein
VGVTAMRWIVNGVWFYRKRLDRGKWGRLAHAHPEINILLALLGVAVAVGVGRYREGGFAGRRIDHRDFYQRICRTDLRDLHFGPDMRKAEESLEPKIRLLCGCDHRC